MPLETPAEYIQVTGKVEILCAFPSAYTSLYKIGESEDGLSIRISKSLGDVPGDRYGGNSGRPIERQFFGESADFQMVMSRWDPVQIAKLESLGGLLATPGSIPLASIGALVHRDHGIRVLLYCVRDPSQTLNFPCCLATATEKGKGTKYSRCTLNVTAERAPEGFWEPSKAGVCYDGDTLGIPDPYTPT